MAYSRAHLNNAARRTAQPKSINIKLEGNLTTLEIRQLLLEALAEMDERPFKTYRNCNFYATPVIPRGNQHLDTIIKAPYPCAADEHKL